MPVLPYVCPPPALPPRRASCPDFHPAALRVTWVDDQVDPLARYPEVTLEGQRPGDWLAARIQDALRGWASCRRIDEAASVHDTAVTEVGRAMSSLVARLHGAQQVAATAQIGVNCLITLDVLLRAGTCPPRFPGWRASRDGDPRRRLELARPLGGLVRLDTSCFGSPLPHGCVKRDTYGAFPRHDAHLEEHHLGNVLRTGKRGVAALLEDGLARLQRQLGGHRPSRG